MDVTDCRPPTVGLYYFIGFVQFRKKKNIGVEDNGFGHDVHMGCLDLFRKGSLSQLLL